MRRPPTLPIVLAGFAAFLDLYATQPLLPLLARAFHASNFAVSLTVTAPTVAVALAAPMVGRLADRFGLRRMILVSAFGLTITTALAASSANLHQLIFWRFVQGLVTPGIFASAIAYIHQEWPTARVGRGMSAYVSGTVLGGFTGRAVAGLVAADATWPAAFLALAALNAVVAFVLLAWLPRERPAAVVAPEARLSQWGAVVRHFHNRQLVTTYTIGFCVLFTQVAMFTYVTFHLAAAPYLLSTAALGWLFVVYLIGAVATPLAGRWVDVYGHRIGLAAAMGVGGIGALLTLVPWLPAVVGGLALSATGVFIAHATTSGYIGTVTTENRGLAVGLYSTFYYAGGSAGAALPAALWNVGGWPACVALVLAVQALGVAIALTQWASRR